MESCSSHHSSTPLPHIFFALLLADLKRYI